MDTEAELTEKIDVAKNPPNKGASTASVFREAKNSENVSVLNAAYLGDAVFELYAREKIIRAQPTRVDDTFNEVKKYVSAAAQAKMYFRIFDRLSAEEKAAMRRGRNAKTASRAKNASVADYRHATGLETLIGYLYLANERERLYEILEMCMETDVSAVSENG